MGIAAAAVKQSSMAWQFVREQLRTQVAQAVGQKLPGSAPTDKPPPTAAAGFANMAKMRRHLAALDLDDSATPEEIRRRYRRLALLSHPDKHPNDLEGAKERFL